MGYRRFMLGLDPDEAPLSRADIEDLDDGLRHWQRTGAWAGGADD